MKSHDMILDRLSESAVYREYERAFTEATRLPVTLRPVEGWQLPLHCKRNEGPFCAMMAQKSKACAACLRVQQELSEKAAEKTHTLTCPHGMSDTAVPVRMADQLIGFLQTGQVFQRRPTEAQFERTLKLCREWGIDRDTADLKESYFKTQILSPGQYESMVKLLTIFAEHLSSIGNQILTQARNAEPPVITRAKDFIREHHAEDIGLAEVAKAVNTSTFYFCKIFKKYTGLNFTEYVSRTRVEKARNLLLNPNLRISEIAYEVGFQSLTHFNRVFKRVAGQSPTEYRDKLPRAAIS